MHSLEPLSFGPEESNFGIVYGVLILDSAPPQPLRFVRIPRGFFHLNYLPYEYQNRIYKVPSTARWTENFRCTNIRWKNQKQKNSLSKMFF